MAPGANTNTFPTEESSQDFPPTVVSEWAFGFETLDCMMPTAAQDQYIQTWIKRRCRKPNRAHPGTNLQTEIIILFTKRFSALVCFCHLDTFCLIIFYHLSFALLVCLVQEFRTTAVLKENAVMVMTDDL